MKKSVLLSFGLFSLTLAIAQNPVPNPGFELWSGTEPNGWATTNVAPDFPVTQTSPGYTGALALKGEVISIGPSAQLAPLIATLANGQGFPVTQVYPAMTFWYKTFFQNGDEMEASVLFTDSSGSIIAAGSVTYSATNASWVQGTVPVINTGGNPANCTIVFSLLNPNGGQSTTGSYYILDDVELVQSSAVAEQTEVDFRFDVFPNPAHDELNLTLYEDAGTELKVEIRDVTGRLISREFIESNAAARRNIRLTLPSVERGMYLVSIHNSVRSFIVQ